MRVADLVRAMESIAPISLAEDWDNVGLLVGDETADLGRVLLCIDYTREVAEERRALGCSTVIAYHPTIFQPLKRVLAGSLVHQTIRDGVSIYSPHTALDVAEGGTNDVLADILGMETRAPLTPHKTVAGRGLGRLGARAEISRAELVAAIKSALGVGSVLVAGPTSGDVTRVACCAGACGDCVGNAISGGAELYLTGELRHHDALRAAAAGMTVVCALHSNSERSTLRRVAARLSEALPGATFVESVVDRDPFSVV